MLKNLLLLSSLSFLLVLTAGCNRSTVATNEAVNKQNAKYYSNYAYQYEVMSEMEHPSLQPNQSRQQKTAQLEQESDALAEQLKREEIELSQREQALCDRLQREKAQREQLKREQIKHKQASVERAATAN